MIKQWWLIFLYPSVQQYCWHWVLLPNDLETCLHAIKILITDFSVTRQLDGPWVFYWFKVQFFPSFLWAHSSIFSCFLWSEERSCWEVEKKALLPVNPDSDIQVWYFCSHALWRWQWSLLGHTFIYCSSSRLCIYSFSVCDGIYGQPGKTDSTVHLHTCI